eukprot:403342551
MSLHYCFIARDPEMIVFETLLSKDQGPKSYKREVKDKLLDLDSIPAENSGYPQEKIYRFLEDIRKEFSAIYKGNLNFIFKQTNLTPNCYDKPFKAAFNKVQENYNTGISNKNLQNAFRKVEEVKDIAARSISQAIDNSKETERLLSVKEF